MKFDPEKLVTPEGNTDVRYMREVARARACRHYGSRNPPPNWVREEFLNLKEVAHIMRFRWRQARGLPDDTVMVCGFQIIEPERLWA